MELTTEKTCNHLSLTALGCCPITFTKLPTDLLLLFCMFAFHSYLLPVLSSHWAQHTWLFLSPATAPFPVPSIVSFGVQLRKNLPALMIERKGEVSTSLIDTDGKGGEQIRVTAFLILPACELCQIPLEVKAHLCDQHMKHKPLLSWPSSWLRAQS